MPESSKMTKAWRTDPVEMGAMDRPRATVRRDRAGVLKKRSVSRSALLRLGASVARAGRLTWSRSDRARPGRFEKALETFAAELASTTEPREIESALLRFAREIAPSARAEIRREPADQPENTRGHLAVFPVRCGASEHGELRVDLDHATDARGVRRQLSVGCTLAGTALEGARLHSGRVEVESHPVDLNGDDLAERSVHRGAEVVRDATFLNAVLPFALGQSRRHGEPLALLCVKLDRLGAIRDILGAPWADRLVHELAGIIGSIVRSSDIVARLEDDRIVALLVRSKTEGARKVARGIVRAVRESGLGSPHLSGVSVSIGVAGFPDLASDAAALLEIADEAMTTARAEGGDRIVEACPTAAAEPAACGSEPAACLT